MLRVADRFSDSDTGRQRRANEDRYFVAAPLFVVADGMGGAQAGERASQTAVKTFAGGIPDGDGSVEQRLVELVRAANADIHAESQRDPKLAGMGTTLTAAYVGEDEISIAHVGDSRAYLLRDGSLEQLTDDHSLVGELVRQGRLTPEEAEDHPQRSIITRALGPEPDVAVDHHSFRARPGDVYLLCSDGLTAMVPEARIGEILRGSPSLAAAGHALIEAANLAGGRDNITVVLFRLEEVDGAGAPPGDQATMIGASAPQASEVRAALGTAAASPQAGATATAPPSASAPPAAAGATVKRTPRMPAPAARRRRRRRIPRGIAGVLAALTIVAVIVVGGWVATQSVYFVGTNSDGLVTVYRGVPYDLPAGLHLYSANFVSGVDAATLAPAERQRLLDHTLRSHDDATNLVRELELGQLQPR